MIFHRCEDVNYCRRKCRRSWQLHIGVIWLSRNCDWRWVGGDGSHSSFWMDDGSLYEFVWTKLSLRCIKHFPTFFLSLNSLVQLPATAHSSKAAILILCTQLLYQDVMPCWQFLEARSTSGFSGINTVSWIYELSRYEFPTPQVSYFKFFLTPKLIII